jgi:hypothetical protein
MEKNAMPHPRQYFSNAEKQRAYRQRHKAVVEANELDLMTRVLKLEENVADLHCQLTVGHCQLTVPCMDFLREF